MIYGISKIIFSRMYIVIIITMQMEEEEWQKVKLSERK